MKALVPDFSMETAAPPLALPYAALALAEKTRTSAELRRWEYAILLFCNSFFISAPSSVKLSPGYGCR